MFIYLPHLAYILPVFVRQAQRESVLTTFVRDPDVRKDFPLPLTPNSYSDIFSFFFFSSSFFLLFFFFWFQFFSSRSRCLDVVVSVGSRGQFVNDYDVAGAHFAFITQSGRSGVEFDCCQPRLLSRQLVESIRRATGK